MTPRGAASPTPWRIEGGAVLDADGAFVVGNAEGHALIVQAVNERAGLIAALRGALQTLELARCGSGPSMAAIDHIRAVLAQSDEPNKEGAKP